MSGSSTARPEDLVSGGGTADFTIAPDLPTMPRDEESSQERPSQGAEGQTTKKSKKTQRDEGAKKSKKPVSKTRQPNGWLLMPNKPCCVVV